MNRSIEQYITDVYTAETKSGKSSKVVKVALVEVADAFYRYRADIDITIQGITKRKVLDFKVKRYGEVTDIKKMTINIAMINPVIKFYPPGKGLVTSMALEGGFYFVNTSNERSLRILEDAFSLDLIESCMKENFELPEKYIELTNENKLTDRTINALKIITNKDFIDPDIKNPDTWKLLIELLHEKYGTELPLTPFDIELFNYLDGLREHLEREWKVIRDDVFVNLEFRNTCYPSSLERSFKRYFYLSIPKLNMIQSTTDSNPLSMISQSKKIYFVTWNKSTGKYEKNAINSKYLDGIIDPMRSKEGTTINIQNELTLAAKAEDTKITILAYTKDFKEVTLKIDEYVNSKILSYDNVSYKKKLIKKNVNGKYKYSKRYRYYETDNLDEIDYIRHPASLLSASTSIIPMINRNDLVRDLTAAHYNTQAIPTVSSQPEIIHTQFSDKLYRMSISPVKSNVEGVVVDVNAKGDAVKINTGTEDKPVYNYVTVNKYNRTKNHTYNIYEPVVKVGDHVTKGTSIFDLNSFKDKELALGTPLLTAYSTLRGREVMDGFVISEKAAEKLMHKEMMNFEIKFETNKYRIPDTYNLPNIGDSIPDEGVVFKYIQVHELKNGVVEVLNLSGEVEKEVVFQIPKGVTNARIADIKICINPLVNKDLVYLPRIKEWQDKCLEDKRRFYDNELYKDEYPEKLPDAQKLDFIVNIEVEYFNKMKRGDKMTNRISSKGLVVEILPESQMPRTQDGKIIEVVMPSLSMASRKNLFSALECQLTLLSKKLYELVDSGTYTGEQWEVIKALYPDDPAIQEFNPLIDDPEKEKKKESMKLHIIGKYGLNGFLRILVEPFENDITPDLIEKYLAIVGVPNGGKVRIIDGVTGKMIRTPVLVGYNNYMRLHFLGEEKGSASPLITYTDKFIESGGHHRKLPQKWGEQENHALLGSGLVDFVENITKSAKEEKDIKIRSEFNSLLLRLSND